MEVNSPVKKQKCKIRVERGSIDMDIVNTTPLKRSRSESETVDYESPRKKKTMLTQILRSDQSEATAAETQHGCEQWI